MPPNELSGLCTWGIILVTCLFSWKGFSDPKFTERNLFSVPEILAEKQFHRLFTSALLHADWNHLLMNMLTLYLFGRLIEQELGIGYYLLIYLAAVLGGGALALWIHRRHEYKAYGASGGVCGVVFSYVCLYPDGGIMVFPLPFWIPCWLYAILYLVGSFLRLKRQKDNIGHDAHIGGAIIGLWTTAAVRPEMVREQPRMFLAVTALALLLFLYLYKNPLFLPLGNFLPARGPAGGKSPEELKAEHQQEELDAVLEKISRTGLASLTRRERACLDAAAKKSRKGGSR